MRYAVIAGKAELGSDINLPETGLFAIEAEGVWNWFCDHSGLYVSQMVNMYIDGSTCQIWQVFRVLGGE